MRERAVAVPQTVRRRSSNAQREPPQAIVRCRGRPARCVTRQPRTPPQRRRAAAERLRSGPQTAPGPSSCTSAGVRDRRKAQMDQLACEASRVEQQGM